MSAILRLYLLDYHCLITNRFMAKRTCRVDGHPPFSPSSWSGDLTSMAGITRA